MNNAWMDDLNLKRRVINMLMIGQIIKLGSHPKINLDVYIVYGQKKWHG